MQQLIVCDGYIRAYEDIPVRMVLHSTYADRWIEGRCPVCKQWVQLDSTLNYELASHFKPEGS